MVRLARLVVVAALVLPSCVAGAEVGRRILDGYRVWSVPLVRDLSSTDLTWSNGRSTEALLKTIPRDLEADAAWFYDRPSPVAGTTPPWAEERRRLFGVEGNYVWNAAVTRRPGFKTFVEKPGARLDEIFTFLTPDGEPYPQYRFYPDIQTGIGLTDRFGWRSRPVTPEKPANVIRIGVLGDSTTSRYPAMVEQWLNRWSAQRGLGVTFEIINAARPASGAPDAGAIFDYEFGSVDLDYAIVYGFGNGIYDADALIKMSPGIIKGRPESAGLATAGTINRITTRLGAALQPWSRWSAAAIFLRSRLTGQRGGSLRAEPPKPATRVAFPPDIDEHSPDPKAIANHQGSGIMALDAYLQGLDRIDAIAKSRDIRLFVSTFRIMAFDGMLLGQGDDDGGNIYNAINRQFWWPFTYAQIHRLIEFYNRTLRAWADQNGHHVIPINEEMPWQPDLYGDGMHEVPAGEALHAWIVLQQLIPAIRKDLAQHRLPRRGIPPRGADDPFWKIECTSVADLIAPVKPTPAPADEVAGAFPLSALRLGTPNAEIVPGAVPLIRTTAAPYAYAAAIPIDTSVAAGLTGPGLVRVRMRVTEGRVSIGILNKTAQKFIAQTSLERGPDVQEVELPIEDLADVGTLMVSNNRPGGESVRSAAELHGVVLMRLRQ